MRWEMIFYSTVFFILPAAAQNPCDTTPGVDVFYAAHRFQAGDVSYVSKLVPREQRLPGLNWQLFFNQQTPAQSFSYPPDWFPSMLPASPWDGDAGVRLDGPDGNAALEVFYDGVSMRGPRPSALDPQRLAEQALDRLLYADSPRTSLCADDVIHPSFAAMGWQQLFVAVTNGPQTAVVTSVVINDPMLGQSGLYQAVVGPTPRFAALTIEVFLPVFESFPKPGGGGVCQPDEPDRDDDGTCDRLDNYPDDPSRQ